MNPQPPRAILNRAVCCLSSIALGLAVLLHVSVAWGADAGAKSLRLLPAKITLDNKESRQTLVPQWISDAGDKGATAGEEYLGQAIDAQLSVSNDEVVKLEGNLVLPVGNGTALITAKVGDRIATAEVTVTGQELPFEWNFRNHVESVLSKQGCNGGACHGARAGQKGFRLTLFGFDVDADYSYLTRQALGRRVVPSDPGRSLILTKTTGLLPHKGGIRLDPTSLEYRVLAEWIGAGTPGPRDDDAQIVSLEVLPKYSHQQIGQEQQLVVLAKFTDGRTEDVTRWAKYTAVNSAVSSVSERGLVKLVGSGSGPIKVWYLNHNSMSFMTVPYPVDIPAERYAAEPKRNMIDVMVLGKLQQLHLLPSPVCDDSTFLRRLYLDTMGILPTPEETQAFLADTSTDKRDRAIDQVLGRPEFVDYWAYKWSDLLLLSGERLRPKAIETYYQWIRGSVASNKPWDKMAHEVVTASGSTHENGAANFYALHQDPEDMAETVSQAFMGLSINCAKCHNHPLEKWTNDQYYGMANMFSRVRFKGWGGDYRGGDGLRVVFTDSQGELIQPSRGVPQPPRPLDGTAVAFEDTTDRRIALANWLISEQNHYFRRAITNRIWANFFGTGLVERVDDLRVTNPASNEELLNAVADDLAKNHYDLKHLMRQILQSTTYQRVSAPLPENKGDERFYSHYYPKRLKAEVLLDAISQVSGIATEFKDRPKGMRALQLPDVAVDSYFLKAFGRPDRLITCDCERSDEPSMTQVLHLYNGDTVNKKLRQAGSVLDKAMEEADIGKSIDHLYLSALSRFPSAKERESLIQEINNTKPEERRAVLEDLYWSVLSSREFLFNH